MLGDEPTNPEQQNNADNDVDTPGLEMPEKEPNNYMFPTYPYTPDIVLVGGGEGRCIPPIDWKTSHTGKSSHDWIFPYVEDSPCMGIFPGMGSLPVHWNSSHVWEDLPCM